MDDDWKQMLEPPPGGLSRLSGAINSDSVRVHHARPVAIAVATFLIVCIALASARKPERKLRDALSAALGEQGQIHVDNGAALEMPSTRPDVRLFAIAQSLPPDRTD